MWKLGVFCLLFSLPLLCGASMKIEYLSEVVSGMIESDSEGSKTVYPKAFVLRNGDEESEVFLAKWQVNYQKQTLEQKIFRANTQDLGWRKRLTGFASDFPIEYSKKIRNRVEQSTSDFIDIENIRTAALFGQSQDGLIVPTAAGDMRVYDSQGKRFEFLAPQFSPKFYETHFGNYHSAVLNQRENVLAFFNYRSFGSEASLSSDERGFLQDNRSFLLWVDGDGVRRFNLLSIQKRLKQILAAGFIKQAANAAVVVLWEATDGKVMLSTHDASGKLLSQAREFYSNIDARGKLSFYYGPSTEQILLTEPYAGRVHFISPFKTVNWIASVEQDALVDGSLFRVLGVNQIDQHIVAKVFANQKVWQFDARAARVKGHDAEKQGLIKINEEFLPPDVGNGELVDVRLVEKDKEVLLLGLWSYTASTKDLDDGVVRTASERFLDDAELSRCQGYLDYEKTFDKYLLQRIEAFCIESKLDCPKMASYSDVEKKLPQFVAYQEAQAQDDMISCLRNSLLFPLTQDKPLDKSLLIYNKNPEEYMRWLKDVKVDAKLVLTIHSNKYAQAKKVRFPGLVLQEYENKFTGLEALVNNGKLELYLTAKDETQDKGFRFIKINGEE